MLGSKRRCLYCGTVYSKGVNYRDSVRSPDLTAPDFFLWGYLKSRVYINLPIDLHVLKENVQEEIAVLSKETF